MRHALVAALVIAFVGLVVGVASYFNSCNPELHKAARDGDTLAWIRCEFKLSAEQLAEVERLHFAYGQECGQHCERIRQARLERERLMKARPVDQAAVLAQEAIIRGTSQECDASVEQHLLRVAAAMSPEEGRRYLERTRPLLRKCYPSEAGKDEHPQDGHQHEHP